MEITDLIAPDRVTIDLQASTKAQLLAELARRAVTATGLPHKQIGDALQARETLGSTGVGAGIAIPHAQIAELDGFYGLFVRLSRPIDYDAIDGHPVDLVFLLLIPANSKEHLQALACVSRRLRDQKVAAELRKAERAHEAYDALTKSS